MLCIWWGGDNTAPSTSAVNYHNINPSFTASFSATENNRQNVVSEDGKITSFQVVLQTAPGGVASYTVTVRKNGVNTAATVTITGAATSASIDLSSSPVSFSDADLLGISFTPSGTPASVTNTNWYINYQTFGNKQIILGSNASTTPTGATNYTPPNGDIGSAWSTTVTDYEQVVPTAGNFTKLRFSLNDGNPGGAGKSYDGYIRINNTSDNLNVNLANTDQNKATTGSISLNAGDTYIFKETPTGTPTGRRGSWAITFEPTIIGEMMFGFGSTAAPSTSANNFEQMVANGNNGWNSSENVRYSRPPASTIKKLYIKTNDPSPGNRTFAFVNNGSVSALSVAIASGSTTGSDTSNNVTLSGGGNTGTFRCAPASSPAVSTGVHLGYVLSISQPLLYRIVNINQSVNRLSTY